MACRLGLIITLGRAIIGPLIGLASGHFCGVLDSVPVRLTDGFLAYPIVAVVMVTVALFGFKLVEMPDSTHGLLVLVAADIGMMVV